MAKKPVLILMAGLPGAGKTTLANNLGQILHLPVLNKDKFKTRFIRRGLDISEDELGQLAYDALFVQSEALLVEQQLSIIFDSATHKEFILKHVTRIVHDAGADMETFLCTAPAHLRQERLEERLASDLYLPFMIPLETVAVENQEKYFEHLPPDRKVIETKDTLDTCLEIALAHLRSSLSFEHLI